jgi:ribosome-associated protein
VRSKKLLTLAEDALTDLKARDVKVLDVRQLTSIADYMVVASGTSDRHVKSIAERLVQRATAAGCPPLGVEGQGSGEWVLVDLADVVVHVMQPRAREFYKLESLWDLGAAATA